jgi:pyrimidine 5'-nucleotidase
MTFTTIFFDLDDTLYPASSGLWRDIRARIGQYMAERMGIPAEIVPGLRREYYEKYGTALRGLEREYPIDKADFLAYVHDLPLERYLAPDPRLRSVLEGLSQRKVIFTNADRAHAGRVLCVLRLEGCFDGVVDVLDVSPYCKPMPESFDIALRLAGEPDPRRCVMIDDMPRTTRAARELGIFSISIGEQPFAPADADAHLQDWGRLPALLGKAG